MPPPSVHESQWQYGRFRVRASDASINRAFNMLMDILKRPSLGHYVRHIEYWARHSACHYLCSGSEGNRQGELLEGEIDLLRAATRKAGFTGSKEDQVVNSIVQRSAVGRAGEFTAQALTALLISFSPDLESMAMVPPFTGYTRLFWASASEVDENLESAFQSFQFPLYELIRRANDDPNDKPYLQNLRSVYFINKHPDVILDDERFYVDMDFFGCLTLVDHLPSIERVGTDILKEDESIESELEPRSSNISKVAVNHSSLDTMYLAAIVCSCRTLREFQYSTGGRSTIDGSYCSFNPKTFYQSILEHKATLEVLDVDIESEVFPFHEPERGEGSTMDAEFDQDNDEMSTQETPLPASVWKQSGSLKDFTALRRLSLGVNMLMYLARGVYSHDSNNDPTKNRRRGLNEVNLVDCLPERLEYLCIRGYERGKNQKYDSELDRLMAMKETAGALTTLKEIQGIENYIPNAMMVEDAEDNPESLWKLEEEWPEEE